MTTVPATRPERGSPSPLGATMRDGGVNFSLYSHGAESIQLVLFATGSTTPAATIVLDPALHRTDNYWHVFVPGLQVGRSTATGSPGPNRPEDGHRFDSSKLLLDPYAREVVDDDYDRALSSCRGRRMPLPPCAGW